jgi:hypothetical protein
MERLGYEFPQPLIDLHEQISGYESWKVEYFPVRRHHGIVPGFGYTFTYFNARIVLIFFNPEFNKEKFQMATVAHELMHNYINIVLGFPGFRFQIRDGVDREVGVKVRTAIKSLVEHPRLDKELRKQKISQRILQKPLFDYLFSSYTERVRLPGKRTLIYKGLQLSAANLYYFANTPQKTTIMRCRKGALPKLRKEARECVRIMEKHKNCLTPETCLAASHEILDFLGLNKFLEIKDGFTND